MSKSPSQGHAEFKVTPLKPSPSTNDTHEVREQLHEIRHKRVAYKTHQARVQAARAKRQALLSEFSHCQKDIDSIDTIGVYVKRKIEFYTVACAALQQEITDARNNFKRTDVRDYLKEEWLSDSNASLLADITADMTIADVRNQEKRFELVRRETAVLEYGNRKAVMERDIEQLRVETHATVRTIQSVKQDRDGLRLFAHEHADRTFLTPGEHDSYIRRQETAQSLRSLEHRIAFVCDLSQYKVKEICSAYRCWLARIKKDNAILYEAIAGAWRWTPKNPLAKACRRIKHRLLSQDTSQQENDLLTEQTDAVQKMLMLCDLQRNNFDLVVKHTYSGLVQQFLLVMRIVMEDNPRPADAVR